MKSVDRIIRSLSKAVAKVYGGRSYEYENDLYATIQETYSGTWEIQLGILKNIMKIDLSKILNISSRKDFLVLVDEQGARELVEKELYKDLQSEKKAKDIFEEAIDNNLLDIYRHVAPAVFEFHDKYEREYFQDEVKTRLGFNENDDFKGAKDFFENPNYLLSDWGWSEYEIAQTEYEDLELDDLLANHRYLHRMNPKGEDFDPQEALDKMEAAVQDMIDAGNYEEPLPLEFKNKFEVLFSTEDAGHITSAWNMLESFKEGYDLSSFLNPLLKEIKEKGEALENIEDTAEEIWDSAIASETENAEKSFYDDWAYEVERMVDNHLDALLKDKENLIFVMVEEMDLWEEMENRGWEYNRKLHLWYK